VGRKRRVEINDHPAHISNKPRAIAEYDCAVAGHCIHRIRAAPLWHDTIQGYELALRKKYFLALAITGFALKEKTDATPPAK